MTATSRLVDLGERELVRRIAAALGPPASGVELGPGDDAAVIGIGDQRIVLTVDRQSEGVHFRRDWLTASEIGRRALAVAVSDVGAMGALPRAALVALALPATVDLPWLDGLLEGLSAGGQEFGCQVVGGDVARSETAVDVCVSVVGALPQGVAAVTRAGADAGQWCWLIGHVGRAAAGRELLSRERLPGDEVTALCVEAYRRPVPPLALGAELARRGVPGAMMDVSDGLAIDLDRLCEASEVGARIDAEALDDPILTRAAAELGADPTRLALAGGDDYALLLSADPSLASTVESVAAAHNRPARRLGIFAGTPAESCLVTEDGPRPLAVQGWDHFRPEPGT